MWLIPLFWYFEKIGGEYVQIRVPCQPWFLVKQYLYPIKTLTLSKSARKKVKVEYMYTPFVCEIRCKAHNCWHWHRSKCSCVLYVFFNEPFRKGTRHKWDDCKCWHESLNLILKNEFYWWYLGTIGVVIIVYGKYAYVCLLYTVKTAEGIKFNLSIKAVICSLKVIPYVYLIRRNRA